MTQRDNDGTIGVGSGPQEGGEGVALYDGVQQIATVEEMGATTEEMTGDIALAFVLSMDPTVFPTPVPIVRIMSPISVVDAAVLAASFFLPSSTATRPDSGLLPIKTRVRMHLSA